MPPVEAEPVEEKVEPEIAKFAKTEEPAETARRMKQQNIKASADCCALFDALARALGMTKADLFEDMVAERFETLQRQGVKVQVVAG
jgi:hypothetical protein